MEDLFPAPSLSAAHSLPWSDVNRLEGWGVGVLHLCLLGGKSRPTLKRNEPTSGGSHQRIGGRVACRKEP